MPEKPSFNPDERGSKDAKYALSVKKRLRETKNVWMEDARDEASEYAVDSYFGEMEHRSQQIADFENIDKFQLKDAADLLSLMQYQMSANNPSRKDQKDQAIYNQSRDIFMSTMQKLHPDMKVNPEILKTEMKKTLRGVKKIKAAQISSALEFHLTSLLAENDPRAQVAQIENIQIEIGDHMNSLSFDSAEAELKAEFDDQNTDQKKKTREQNQEALYFTAETMYRLELLKDLLTSEESEEPEQPIEAKEETKALPIEEVDRIFNDKSIRTIQDIQKVVTPEAKTAILIYILEDVNRKIEAGKAMQEKSPDTVVGATVLTAVMGFGAVGDRKLQFPASAVEGNIVDGNEVAGMRVDEFLKKYFDFDLREDDELKSKLEKYTNMLWK